MAGKSDARQHFHDLVAWPVARRKRALSGRSPLDACTLFRVDYKGKCFNALIRLQLLLLYGY